MNDQRFQAREDFSLDGRAVKAGEVFYLHPSIGALYATRGAVIRLADNADAPPVDADHEPRKTRKTRGPNKPRSAADLEIKKTTAEKLAERAAERAAELEALDGDDALRAELEDDAR